MLQAADYKIKWHHGEDVSTGLQYTRCTMFLEGEEPSFHHMDISICHPKDNFCYDTGRKVSLQKVLRKTIPREDIKTRRAIWEAYRTMTKKPRW